MERNRVPYVKGRLGLLPSPPSSRVAQLSSTPRGTSSNTTVTPARGATRMSIGTPRKGKAPSRKASFSCDLGNRKQPSDSDAPNERAILDGSRRPSISINVVAAAADAVTANVPQIVRAVRSGRRSIADTGTPSSVDSVPNSNININQPKRSMRAGRDSIMATSSSVARRMSRIKTPMRSSSSRGGCSKAAPSRPATPHSPEQLLPFTDGVTGTVSTNPFEGVYSAPQPPRADPHQPQTSLSLKA